MSFEGPDKQRRSGIVEATAFAATLLGAIDHGPAQALEIPPGMSWEQGIRERVRGAVMKENKENEAMYLRFSDGTSTWVAIYAGSIYKPGDDRMTVQNTLQTELNHLSERHRGKTAEVRCVVHGHPDIFKFPTVQGKEYSPQLKPPSYEDVKASDAHEQYKWLYSILKIEVKQNIEAAADNSGLWYFKRSSQQSFDPEKLEAWKKTYTNFVGGSFFKKDFNFEVEYQKLRHAYRDYLGADVRFVSYENISKEPPCAGVDYKPGMLKPNYDVKVNQPAATPRKKGPEIIVRPADKIQMPEDIPTRPGLGELDKPQTRPHIGDQEPPIFNVGPPDR